MGWDGKGWVGVLVGWRGAEGMGWGGWMGPTLGLEEGCADGRVGGGDGKGGVRG